MAGGGLEVPASLRRVLSSRVAARSALAISLTVSTVAPAVWLTGRHSNEVGIVPVQAGNDGQPVASQRRPSLAIPIEIQSARLADQVPLVPGPTPERLRIPAIGLDAPVSSVGADTSTG